ncbi:hypothetical protein E2C01_035361 [Portunus trituberculatus]|uniref:Uncharacterized protein n=1 Tax=Portunus trituberculatus TaxID=210409 RepID=A0A5B7F9J7_PORTR|nr:hypothetical protein [Portunus trituberculatus]
MKKPPLQDDRVIYKHTCKIEDCGPQTYIGMTWTTLQRRLTCHLQNGTIKNHYIMAHKTTATRKHLEENTTIIGRERPMPPTIPGFIIHSTRKTSYEPTNTRSTDITHTKKKTNVTCHCSEPATNNTEPTNAPDNRVSQPIRLHQIMATFYLIHSQDI